MGMHTNGDSIGNKRSLSGREKSIKLIQKIENDLPEINIEKGTPYDIGVPIEYPMEYIKL